jgi:hypothetical protein
VEGYVTHRLSADARVRVGRAMPALPGEVDRVVELLWQRAAERIAAAGGGRLFNGRVFSADAITPEEIIGHLTEFRRIVAQMERPSLFAELGLRPLAACGVLRCAGGIVVGRRHPAAIYEAGMWQLPPAGSVDAGAVTDGEVDLPRQLLSELREELGLLPEDVTSPRLLCVVEHPSHVCDVGMLLSTRLDAETVLTRHKEWGNGEYPLLRVVPEGQLADFVAEHRGSLVPSATVFLTHAGLLTNS